LQTGFQPFAKRLATRIQDFSRRLAHPKISGDLNCRCFWTGLNFLIGIKGDERGVQKAVERRREDQVTNGGIETDYGLRPDRSGQRICEAGSTRSISSEKPLKPSRPENNNLTSLLTEKNKNVLCHTGERRDGSRSRF